MPSFVAESRRDPPVGDACHKRSPTLKLLYLVLIFFVGLALNSKDGRDRWIYFAFAAATVVALVHYRQIPWLYHGHWRF